MLYPHSSLVEESDDNIYTVGSNGFLAPGGEKYKGGVG